MTPPPQAIRQLMPRESARFWAKVDKGDSPESCWLWTAYVSPDGYARFWVSPVKRLAHRVAYIDAVGQIPDGLQLDHLCKVRHCVNPTHLEPVSEAENKARGDGVASINRRKKTCLRGAPLHFRRPSKRWACREDLPHLPRTQTSGIPGSGRTTHWPPVSGLAACWFSSATSSSGPVISAPP